MVTLKKWPFSPATAEHNIVAKILTSNVVRKIDHIKKAPKGLPWGPFYFKNLFVSNLLLATSLFDFILCDIEFINF